MSEILGTPTSPPNKTKLIEYPDCVASHPRTNSPPCQRENYSYNLYIFMSIFSTFFVMTLLFISYWTNSLVVGWWKELLCSRRILRSTEKEKKYETVNWEKERKEKSCSCLLFSKGILSPQKWLGWQVEEWGALISCDCLSDFCVFLWFDFGKSFSIIKPKKTPQNKRKFSLSVSQKFKIVQKTPQKQEKIITFISAAPFHFPHLKNGVPLMSLLFFFVFWSKLFFRFVSLFFLLWCGWGNVLECFQCCLLEEIVFVVDVMVFWLGGIAKAGCWFVVG